MKIPFLPALALGSVAFALLAAVPTASNGQANSAEPALPATLLTELAAQQAAIDANQTKIEEKIAKIAEDVRLARIYVARGGGGKK